MSEVYPNSCACHLRISALKAENEALKKERDTWKQEHENLVHVRQVDLAAVAGRLEAVTKDRDEWVKRAGEGL